MRRGIQCASLLLAAACAAAGTDTDVALDSDTAEQAWSCLRDELLWVDLPWSSHLHRATEMRLVTATPSALWLEARAERTDASRIDFWWGFMPCRTASPEVVWTWGGQDIEVHLTAGEADMLLSTTAYGATPREDVVTHQRWSISGGALGEPMPFELPSSLSSRSRTGPWMRSRTGWRRLRVDSDGTDAEVVLVGLDEQGREQGVLRRWEVGRTTMTASGPWFAGADRVRLWDAVTVAPGRGSTTLVELRQDTTSVELLTLDALGSGGGAPGDEWTLFQGSAEGAPTSLVHPDGRVRPVDLTLGLDRIEFDTTGHWLLRSGRLDWLGEADTVATSVFEERDRALGGVVPMQDGFALALWLPVTGAGTGIVRRHRRPE